MNTVPPHNNGSYFDEIQRGIEGLINCMICTEPYKNPKILPCQHTFCHGCLEQYFENQNSQRIVHVSNFPCPSCRKTVYLPIQGVNGLNNDFKVGQIKDFLEKINVVSDNEDGALCDVCKYTNKKNKAHNYCVDCSKYLCSNCTHSHADTAIFASHSTITIGSHDTTVLQCKEHKEEIKYYCTPCNVPLCTVCALSVHSKHASVDIPTALQKQKQTLTEKVDELQVHMQAYEEKAGKLLDLQKEKDSVYKETKSYINQQTKNCIDLIKEQQKELLGELEDYYGKVTTDIKTSIEGIKEQVTKFAGVCDSAHALVEANQPLQMLATSNMMTDRLKMMVNLPCAPIGPELTGTIDFKPASVLSIGNMEYRRERSSSPKPKTVGRTQIFDFTYTETPEAVDVNNGHHETDMPSNMTEITKTESEMEDVDIIKGENSFHDKLSEVVQEDFEKPTMSEELEKPVIREKTSHSHERGQRPIADRRRFSDNWNERVKTEERRFSGNWNDKVKSDERSVSGGWNFRGAKLKEEEEQSVKSENVPAKSTSNASKSAKDTAETASTSKSTSNESRTNASRESRTKGTLNESRTNTTNEPRTSALSARKRDPQSRISPARRKRESQAAAKGSPSRNSRSSPVTPRKSCTSPTPAKTKTQKQLWQLKNINQSRDCAFLSDRKLLAAEFIDREYKLDVFDAKGNLCRALSGTKCTIRKPWGIAINNIMDTFVVTDQGDRSVKVLNHELSIRNIWRRPFSKPAGVAIMSTGELVITDVGDTLGKVNIFQPNGVHVNEFTVTNGDRAVFSQPNYVTVDHHDRIIISDSQQKCVRIMDRSGKQLNKFSSTDHTMVPQGVCVDSQNNIIVADQGNNTIGQYSPDGQFIGSVVKTLDQPWSVSLHEAGLIAVGTDTSITVYENMAFKAM